MIFKVIVVNCLNWFTYENLRVYLVNRLPVKVVEGAQVKQLWAKYIFGTWGLGLVSIWSLKFQKWHFNS